MVAARPNPHGLGRSAGALLENRKADARQAGVEVRDLAVGPATQRALRRLLESCRFLRWKASTFINL